jgi:hypothetical protein
VIAANANILPRVEFCATLANDDIAGDYEFATKTLDTEALALAIAPVAG